MGNAFLLIVVGLLLFYIVISDKFKCVEGFAGCLLGAQSTTPTAAPTVQAPLPNTTNAPTLPNVSLALNTNWATYGF